MKNRKLIIFLGNDFYKLEYHEHEIDNGTIAGRCECFYSFDFGNGSYVKIYEKDVDDAIEDGFVEEIFIADKRVEENEVS